MKTTANLDEKTRQDQPQVSENRVTVEMKSHKANNASATDHFNGKIDKGIVFEAVVGF